MKNKNSKMENFFTKYIWKNKKIFFRFFLYIATVINLYIYYYYNYEKLYSIVIFLIIMLFLDDFIAKIIVLIILLAITGREAYKYFEQLKKDFKKSFSSVTKNIKDQIPIIRDMKMPYTTDEQFGKRISKPEPCNIPFTQQWDPKILELVKDVPDPKTGKITKEKYNELIQKAVRKKWPKPKEKKPEWWEIWKYTKHRGWDWF